ARFTKATLAGEINERRREIDCEDIGAPLRELDRKRARAATGIENSRACKILWQPAHQSFAHHVAPGTDGLPDASHRRIGGELGPGLDRRAIEVGLEFSASLKVGNGWHQSNPKKSKISRSFIGLASSGAPPSIRLCARRRYSFCAASS